VLNKRDWKHLGIAFLIYLSFILVLLALGEAKEETFEVRIEYSVNASTLKITLAGNTSTTYATINDINTTLSQTFQFEQEELIIIQENRTELDSFLSNKLDEKFRDQRDFFFQTVVPSQQNLTYFEGEFTGCASALSLSQSRYVDLNTTIRDSLVSQIDTCEETQSFLAYLLVFAGILVLLVFAFSSGVFQRVKEEIHKRGIGGK